MEENKELVENPDYPVNLSDSNFSDAVKKYKVLVVDFWAPWCMPCRIVEPSVENLAKKYQGKVVFGRMNVDESPNTPSMFSIMSIPTLLIFKDSIMADSIIGAVPEKILEDRILRSLEV
jgi:thioredoxin 1